VADFLSVAGLTVSTGVAITGAILRYTVARQDAERDRRFHDLERSVENLKSTHHTLKVDVVRVEGQLNVLRSEHDSVDGMLQSIRTDMIGRREWEARMNGFEDALRGIREQLSNVARLMQSDLVLSASRENK
jgi:hypothetical protein